MMQYLILQFFETSNSSFMDLSSSLEVGNTCRVALLVVKRITFSAAAILINTGKARGAVISTLTSRSSIDFDAASSVISPPAVTFSRVKGISHAVFCLNIARLAGTSERASNE